MATPKKKKPSASTAKTNAKTKKVSAAKTAKAPIKEPKKRSKPQTVREKAEKTAKKRAPRTRKSSAAVKKSSSKVGSFLTSSVQTHDHKEDSRTSALTKHRSFVPSYFRNAFNELRNVTWPRLPEALRLTFAVVVFATVFAALVSGLDWVLDKIFEELILNESQNIREFLNDLF